MNCCVLPDNPLITPEHYGMQVVHFDSGSIIAGQDG
jgi:hypothetical protein